MTQEKIDLLRKDLEAQFSVINPDAKSILIVQPKDPNLLWTKTYMDWILDTLKGLRPDISIVVFPEGETKITGNLEGETP